MFFLISQHLLSKAFEESLQGLLHKLSEAILQAFSFDIFCVHFLHIEDGDE